MAASHSTARYALNIVFAIICTLIIIWFYQFYRLGKLNANTDENTGYGNRTPFFIAVALLVLLVLQFFLMWNTGDRLAAYTIIPLLVGISLFAWASWELSTGTTEVF
jgi:divalent metal cation (Fe/Co/Zn/Cd) transporter